MIDKSALIVTPRLAIQKGDFLGSGVPYWPIEAAILAAQMRESGWDVTVLDLFGSAPQRLARDGGVYWQGRPLEVALKDRSIHPVEFSVTWVYALSSMSHQELLKIVRTLKDQGFRQIVVFENSQAVTGYDITQTVPFFQKAGADYLLAGEAYSNWNDLETYLRSPGGETPGNLMNLSDANPKPAQRFTRSPIHTPVPAWDLFPYQNYWLLPYSHGPKSAPYFPILTSRGCPYPCTFCVVPATNAQKWRPRSPEEVVQEMEVLHHDYHVDHFQWEDLNSTIDRERIQSIGRLLKEKRLSITFRLVSGTKVETLDIPTLNAMAQAGCDYISISPESGSPRILQKMRKPFDHAHALRMVESMHARGIHSQCCFVLGHPEETDDDRRLTESYVKKLVQAGVDEVAFFILSPLPGSALQDSISYADYSDAIWSFTPRHRLDYATLEQWRRRLIRRFLWWKIRYHPLAFLRQAWNALVGRPASKMEMLPRRVYYVLKAMACA